MDFIKFILGCVKCDIYHRIVGQTDKENFPIRKKKRKKES